MNVTDEIKAHIDIVDLVSQTVKLRRTGKNYIGFCPFHSNTRTPAFVVFPETGTWRCFGECSEGGDIFKYIMKKEGLDFPEALKTLAQRAGVKLKAFTPEKKEENEQAERLRRLLEEAVIFYHSHLLQSPQGQEAYRYLIDKRGLQPQTIETFGIGYSPESWDAVNSHFTSKGYTPAELLQTGLIVERDEGGYYDRFRNRIMFPVRDASGRMAGFGARILNPQDAPKFINSPQTLLFDKSHLLYGLDQARKPIREADQAIIVEGYLDVVVLHQEGCRIAVSPMGTALTEAQMRQIKRFTRRIVMALDPDSAGIKATLRGLEIARDALDHSDDIIFDARGLIHHESRLQADLRVSALPEGMDPDDIVRKDPAQWNSIIDAAKPIITHVMNTISLGRDLDDPKTKSQIASQIMPLIRDVPNSVERDAYRQQLARLLKIDDRALMSLSNPVKKIPAYKKQRGAIAIPDSAILIESSVREKIRSLEKHCLQLLILQPEITYRVDRALQSAGLANLSERDFENEENQQMASLIFQSLAQDELEPFLFIHAHLPPALEELMAELNPPPPVNKPGQERIIEDLTRTALNIRHTRVLAQIEQLRSLQEEATKSGEVEVSAYQAQIMEQIKTRGKLDRALAKPFKID